MAAIHRATDHPRHERRTFGRLETRWDALWEAEQREELAKVRDASAGGVFLQPRVGSVQCLSAGSRVRLCLFVPQLGPVELMGTVRRAGPSLAYRCDGWGIEFDQACKELDEVLFARQEPAPNLC